MKQRLMALAMTAALTLVAAELTDAQWTEMKREALNRQRLAIYDNDCDDALCFPMDRPVTPENYLALRTSYLHNYPIDTIVCNATYGCFDQLVFNNDAGSLVDFDWKDWNPDTKVMNIVPELIRQGTGVMEEQLKYARAHNIEFFAGIRINDVHDVIDTPEKPVPFFSKWKRENPQLLLGRGMPWADWSAVDFEHREVRDKFVAIVAEIVKRYSVDGISIDLQRTCRFFKSAGRGEMPSREELDMLRDMFRKVRQVTEHYGRLRGKPILIAIRGLDDIGYSKAVGFDWEGTMQDGSFDIFFAGGTIHLTPWRDSVALCHKYGLKCYASIDEALCGFPAPRLGRRDPVSYFARVAAAYQQGVDGIYYFNLFNPVSVRDVMLGGPEKYRDLDKRYHLNPTILWPPKYIVKDGDRFNRFPLLSPRFKQRLAAGKSMSFVVEWGDDIDDLVARGFPVEMEGTLLAQNPTKVSIKSNGVAWECTGGFADVAKYNVPRNAFHPGLNTVVLTNESDQEMEIVDASIDLNLHPKAKEALEEITDWSQQCEGQKMLCAGNYAYRLVPMDAEFEAKVNPGDSTVAYISIGGMMTRMKIFHDHIEFLDGGIESVAIKPLVEARTFRVYIEEKIAKIYLEGNWLEFGTKSVSMTLRDDLPELAQREDIFPAFRNGGIAFDGAAEVKAIRLRMKE